ncbi:hypothetical protein BJY04DRAFT_192308 [Aspergillus karnatakaensis]|uniref:uncharacterized protein n=1 Tax=Aspergillus karnatakaensis TaxID=1810916 RepID=UPI003CCCA627
MSQQDGISSSLASIEAAPPIHGTQTTTTISHPQPSTSSTLTSISLSTAPPASNSSRFATVSGRVQIPKLSAATTELLARLAGTFRGVQQQSLHGDVPPPINQRSPGLDWDTRNSKARWLGTMKVSSTFIELPSAPFVYPSRAEAPTVTPTPAILPSASHNFVDNNVTELSEPVSLGSYPTTYPTLAPAPLGPQVPVDIPQPRLPQPLVPPRPGPLILKFSNPKVLQLLNLATRKPQPALLAKPTSAARYGRGPGIRKSGSKKRKRGHGSDGEDVIRAVDSSSDESDIAPIATQTKSGRAVNRPTVYIPSPLSPALANQVSNVSRVSDRPRDILRARKRAPRKGKNTNITCKYCQRGHSPPSNAIVFCDGCNRPWHQRCHDPPIGNEVVTVKEKEWLCRECRPVEIAILHPTVVRSNPNMASRSLVVPPLTMPRIEVGGERFPTDDRRRFLTSLSHTALVELLLTISDQQPTIPMFPENMGSLPSSRFPMAQAVADAATNATTAVVSGTPQEISTSTLANGYNANEATKSAAERNRRRYYEESSDEDSEYEFQEHRLYPRAGNGVQLSINEEDLDILREDPACATFSYTLHGPTTSIAANVSA